MKKIKIISDDNYKDFKISISINAILDSDFKGITLVKKNMIIDKIFGLKRFKFIDTDTFHYEICINIKCKGFDTIVVNVQNLDKNRYLIPFISYTEIKDLQFLNAEYLPNLNVEHIMSSCKKELKKIEIIQSQEFIKEIIALIKTTIKNEKLDLKKKDISKMNKLNISIEELKNYLINDINRNNLPKQLSEYINIFKNNNYIHIK